MNPFEEFLVLNYRENDSPQPQVLLALGLLKTNPLPFKPPLYSRVVPTRYKKLFLSTAILTLFSSKTLSFSPIPPSKSN